MTRASARATRRTRILMIVDRLDDHSGGAERFMAALAAHLPSERFEVWALTTRGAGGSALKLLEDSGVRHVSIERNGMRDTLRLRRLANLLRTQHFDVVHAHKFGSNVWGTLFGRLFRVPVVIAHEQTWSYEGQPLRRLLDGRLIGRLATRFIAVSAADRERMISIEGVPAHKTVLIPNAYVPRPPQPAGSLRDELGVAAGTPLVGTIAMLRPQKAISLMLQAHAQVLRSHPSTRLVIAGDGECRDALERETNRRGLDSRVHFLGVRQDGDRILRDLDVALLSSDFEGTPLFVLECMSNATALVSTDVGGIPDLVTHDESALLVPRQDAASFARAVCSLIEEPERARALGARAHAELGPYRIATVAGRFADLYEELLAEYANGRGA
jgi:glycosyltransferase involved in cell wall biosynthesis